MLYISIKAPVYVMEFIPHLYMHSHKNIFETRQTAANMQIESIPDKFADKSDSLTSPMTYK